MRKTTWTWIHRRSQHEARWKCHRSRRARNRYRSIFERLTHHFEHVALKLRQFVEKKHAVMRERNFSGARHGAAADQSGIADGMVRRTKRPRTHEAARIVEQPGNAVDPRGFNCFFQ